MTTIESSPDAVAATSDATSGVLGWLVELFTSTDHKVTGRLYLTGGLLGLAAAVVVNILVGVERIDGGDLALDADIWPQLLDAQRLGLVFATLLPLATAACVAFVPLQVGARSIAFPRLASLGFWMWFGGVVLMTIAIAGNGGTAGSNGDMVDLFIASIGLSAIGLTATAGSVATTVLTTRAPGMTMRRVPPFTWSALVYALGLILVLPVLLGTVAYLFVDHRNGRTGFGGNVGIVEWIGWVVTQPATFLFAVPAVGLLAELAPVTFARRTPARGVLFGGIAFVGVAALAGVAQQSIVSLPWSGSRLSTADLDDKVRDLVPFLFFNALPLVGALIVALVLLVVAKPARGMTLNITAGFVFAAVAFGVLLVALVGNVLHAIDDIGLQGTVFDEGSLVLVAYAGALAAMGAVAHWAPKWWGAGPSTASLAPLALLGAAGAFLAGVSLYIAGFLDQEAGPVYANDDLVVWNVLSLAGHALMALTVVGFVALLVGAARTAGPGADDPWHGHSIEWATTSPAPRDNFVDVPVVHSAEPMLDHTATDEGSAA